MNITATLKNESVPEARRFVVLRHDWPKPHRDLIVESRAVAGADRLPTWALYCEVPESRTVLSDRPISGRVVPLEPHRREYLDYEGPVSGGRGKVVRECHGLVIGLDMGGEGGAIEFELELIGPDGRVISGEFRIERKPGDPAVRQILVSGNHEIAAAAGDVFEWRPKDRGGTSEDGTGD